MGQRLVVTIGNNQKDLCNIYYHWSAYTTDALYEIRNIINCICNKDDKSESDLLLRLIHFCENNGGGISGGGHSDEWEYIQNLYPNEVFKTEGISRNDGLISVSEKEMQVSQDWSEGDVFINLDNKFVSFGVYAEYDSLEEYIDERKSWDDDFDESEFKLEDIPDIGCILGYFKMDDIHNIIDVIENADDIVRNGSEIYELTC